MDKKPELCGFHCPGYMLWLFTAIGLWFTLSAFGVPTFGSFWSWIVLACSACTTVCMTSPKHQQTACPFRGFHPGIGIAGTLIGIWFVLGDVGLLPTFGLNLLYIVTFLSGLAAITYKNLTIDKIDPSYQNWRWRTYLSDRR